MIYKVCNDHYIAAVIEGTWTLAYWLTKVPKHECDNLRIEQMTGVSYPFELSEFEKDGKRIFLGSLEKETKAMQKTIKNLRAELLATYRIDKDFFGDPKKPGQDYMGILPHEHEEEHMVPVDCLSKKK